MKTNPNTNIFESIHTVLPDTSAFRHTNGVVWVYMGSKHTKYYRTEADFRTFESNHYQKG